MPSRLPREVRESASSKPHVVEQIQGINVETGLLRIGDTGRSFYASKRPTETLLYLPEQDFELSEMFTPIGEFGIAITDDTCTMYGVLKVAGDATTTTPPDRMVAELELPQVVWPMFEVFRMVIVGHTDELGPENSWIEPGMITINPETGTMSVSRVQVGPVSGYEIHFGQLQYIKK